MQAWIKKLPIAVLRIVMPLASTVSVTAARVARTVAVSR